MLVPLVLEDSFPSVSQYFVKTTKEYCIFLFFDERKRKKIQEHGRVFCEKGIVMMNKFVQLYIIF